MTGPSLDLDALRKKAEKADGYHVLIHPRDVFAVLALVEEQRKENERLEIQCGFLADMLRDALAVSPAENKEP